MSIGRSSERKVRDDLCKTAANLFEGGLSLKEVSTAVIEVGNGMFGRKWKNPEDSEESFDTDTLPNTRNIRIALQQIEALSLVVDMLMMEKEKGRMASDSTTKKGGGSNYSAGSACRAGLSLPSAHPQHLWGQDCPYPMPILSIHGGRIVPTLCPSSASMGAGLSLPSAHPQHPWGQDCPYPLPILSIHGETTEDIAMRWTWGRRWWQQ